MKIYILQLPKNNINKFRIWNWVKKDFNFHNYQEVYTCDFETTKELTSEILEDIFYVFNSNHPLDYKSHSLSVSDIVGIYSDKEKLIEYFYCDSMGFKKLPIYILI